MIDLLLIVILCMMSIFALLIPIVFCALNKIEDIVEDKYGDATRRKFVNWTGYIYIHWSVNHILRRNNYYYLFLSSF
jgi:hypothetical protein